MQPAGQPRCGQQRVTRYASGRRRPADELSPLRAMGGAIFNGNINGRATAWMMVGMLIFAVMWESFTSYLERRFEGNKAHSEMTSDQCF